MLRLKFSKMRISGILGIEFFLSTIRLHKIFNYLSGRPFWNFGYQRIRNSNFHGEK